MIKNGKKILTILFVFILCLLINSNTTILNANASLDDIYLGGFPAGFSLQTKGALIVSLCDVLTPEGLKSPAKEAGVDAGDKILYINDVQVNSAKDVSSVIDRGGEFTLKIERKGVDLEKKIIPAKDLGGEYKLGVFIKDEISGIGTVTYIKGNRFASLGHPVLDENNEILDITGGNVYNCNIVGYVKGEKGKAGELKGAFVKNNASGLIEKNLLNGVYGRITDNVDLSNLIKVEVGRAKVGRAKILSTIKGVEPQEYEITIVKIDDNQQCKNFVIKVTDDNLLCETGGIVQGMSGSPILQDGKLVGAVTHVFINDPTRGFGINIDKMINN